MIHAFVYLIIGTAISYFMQGQIKQFAENVTQNKFLQTVIKILTDAIMSITWVVTPFLIVIYNKSRKKK